ncbi:TetR/AcrR family transcriptional regulator [Saccharomonospora piscinae]|uniref:TetR/AcrR family transcriptional regulator n=1 Tax=Saccharomonospora piscinae TaxID=687388 RepID=UPI001106E60C|nr:TetR/AcrR family transcriptional regulator [Saccharomonospora piscinae]TLW92300.1 TetR/AcrR family transcriptional regulator [Saccharomonospora piscinae]
MARPRTTETRERIQAAALELFLRQGVRQTSLREIAEQLGLTKPALYYHFTSRDDLVASLLRPLAEDVEALIAEDEATGPASPRDLLGRYFDLSHRHRALTALLARDLGALAELGFVERIVEWRRRLTDLLVGPDAGVADRARAIVALGGLGDCLVLLADTPVERLRPAALDAACSALGPLADRPA